MLARATAATPWGIEARPVQVEIDLKNGVPGLQIVGLADGAVRESRERIRAAVRNCGFELPPRSVLVNLAPADLRKEGNHLDLAMALALLVAYEKLPHDAVAAPLFCGELGLDGAVRPVRGTLAMADLARRLGSPELLVPASNAQEAAALRVGRVIPVRSLAEAVAHLRGETVIAPAQGGDHEAAALPAGGADLADVRGQESAKRALEIAAAGGHNLIFIGPPGAGKTMLARRLPGLLPPLTHQEALEVTKIHSLAAEEPPGGLVRVRPFRSPHAGTSAVGLVGGGHPLRPGEASLAHGGVLFLDELPEFRRDSLEALRQPLEEGHVTIVRVRARLRFPARFSLLAAMNPCPCGHLGDPRHACRCPGLLVDRYRARVSGPLLDRIDLHVEVPAVRLRELREEGGETSATVAARVAAARDRQEGRLGGTLRTPCNAAMTADLVARHCRPDAGAQRLLDAAFERLGLSARALHRILKVARTLADLAGVDGIAASHVAEAIQLRSLDRRLGG